MPTEPPSSEHANDGPLRSDWDNRVWDPLDTERTIRLLEKKVGENHEAIFRLRDFINTVVAPEVLLAQENPKLYDRQNLHLSQESLGSLDVKTREIALSRWESFTSNKGRDEPNVIIVDATQRKKRAPGFSMILHFDDLRGLQKGNWTLESFKRDSLDTELPMYLSRDGDYVRWDVRNKIMTDERLRNLAMEMAKIYEGSASDAEKNQYRSHTREQLLMSSSLMNTLFDNILQITTQLLGSSFKINCSDRVVTDDEMTAYSAMTDQLFALPESEVRFGMPRLGGYCRIEPRFNLATGKREIIQHFLRSNDSGEFIESGITTTLIPMDVVGEDGNHIGGVIAHVTRYPDNGRSSVNFFHPSYLLEDFEVWQSEEKIRAGFKNATVASSDQEDELR